MHLSTQKSTLMEIGDAYKNQKKNDNVLHLSHLRQNKILGQPHLVKSKQAFTQVLQ